MNQDEETRIVDFAESMNKIYDEKETLFKEKMELLKLVGNIDAEVKSALNGNWNDMRYSGSTFLKALRQIKKVIDEFDKDRNKEKEVHESYIGTRGK